MFINYFLIIISLHLFISYYKSVSLLFINKICLSCSKEMQLQEVLKKMSSVNGNNKTTKHPSTTEHPR